MDKLSNRVMALEGPDREIDVNIALAKGWKEYKPNWFYPSSNVEVAHHRTELPRYTASLDAAMSLVPEGWGVMLHVSENGLHSNVCLARSHPTNLATYGDAATPALALCAAALKARGL